MDIKWKNRGLLISLLALLTFGMSGILSILEQGSTYFKSNYFKTSEFEGEISTFINNLSVFELNEITKEEMKRKIAVTEDDIEQYRSQYGDISVLISEINIEYDNRIQEAKANNNQEEESFLIEERDKKIEEWKKILQDDEYVKARVLKEKQQSIENYYRNMESNKGQFRLYQSAFSYYLKDSETGQVFTNIANPNKEGIDKGDNVVFLRNYPSPKHGSIEMQGHTIYNEENDMIALETGVEGKVFEGQIAIFDSEQTTNFILEKSKSYRERQYVYFIHTLLSILALGYCVYLYKKQPALLSNFYEKWKPVYLRVPMDVRLIIAILTVVFTLVFIATNGSPSYYLDAYNEIYRIITFMLLTPVVGILIFQGKLLFESMKNRDMLKEDWKGSLMGRFFQNLKEAFLNWRVGTQLVAILFIVFMFGAGAMIVLIENSFIFPYAFGMIVLGIPLGLIIIKQAGYFNRILHFTNKLETGDFDKDLPIKGRSVLVKLGKNLNAIKQDLKTSQNEQAKSERLKAELITNVSHDLRTPLTSIITYAELLKNKDLEEDERESYLQIIDRKSKRLKVLIDDLFEVSKMTSGSIELKKEKVDICQLVEQALAEYNETIEQSTLEFRVSKPETPVYVTVDGQKVWRAFDNLIGNIFKYSLNHTRVYISVETVGDKVNLTFKNISKYELGGNTDEMLERFKRGDTSRHTEGSGLGLAIAKSIIDLHEGKLEIDVDGDLFKVTVTL